MADSSLASLEGCIPLITGGAGYIGSHVVHLLNDLGIRPVVLDDLSSGRRDLLPDGVTFVEGDVGDQDLVERICRDRAITAVIHFAGSILVSESVERPLHYYRNNVGGGLALIEATATVGIDQIVFSSSAAVYGAPDHSPIPETAPTQPINPYGWTKLITERMLVDAQPVTGQRHVALRYFNVAGADALGRTGECRRQATHLINVASEVAAGRRPSMVVHGTDYATPDGTCVRDYVHVSDLADAHVRALSYLATGGASQVLNCGYGHGFSVRQVLMAVEAVTGAPLAASDGARRAGDPPQLVADAARIRDVLGWRPQFDDLETIIASAIDWERRRPN